jgi:hypothetical protein
MFALRARRRSGLEARLARCATCRLQLCNAVSKLKVEERAPQSLRHQDFENSGLFIASPAHVQEWHLPCQ